MSSAMSGRNAFKRGVSELLEGLAFLLAMSSASIPRRLMLLNFGPHVGYQNFNTGLVRFCRKGYISNLKVKKANMLKALSLHRQELFGDYVKAKLDRWHKPWDGKWRLIIYDIPEKFKFKRERLRSVLKMLGFGKIQKSSWACAYDHSALLYDICKKEKMLEHVCIYEGGFFSGKDIGALVNDAWPLKKTKEAYLEILDRCDNLAHSRQDRFLDVYGEYMETYMQFKQTIAEDPFLPPQCLSDWPYRDVEARLKRVSEEVIKKLKAPAL